MRKVWYLLAMLLLGSVLFPYSLVLAADYELLKAYPREDRWFTQGLELTEDGRLLMSTGQYGDSKIGYMDLDRGTLTIQDDLPSRVFGEGVTQTPTAVWQITYKEGLAYKRDPQTLAVLETVSYQGEGWGLAYDAETHRLWMTNGSTKLQERDADSFELKQEIEVTEQGRPVKWLNELEYVEGKLYGNIWQSNRIVRLDPQTGQIEASYDLTNLIKDYHLEPVQGGRPDVLNGIAHIEGDRFYLTGKYYPYLFEVRLK